MTKQIVAIAVLCIGAALCLTTPAHATEVNLTTNPSLNTDGSYDSPVGYDYSTPATTPPTSYQNIGTFNFTIPAGVASITVSGSFGDSNVSTTALSDYYLGFSGDQEEEEAVEVAACDSITANCYSGQEGPYSWSVTLTPTEIAALGPGLAAGSLDFGYTWDTGVTPTPDPLSPTGYDAQYVYAGAATLDITPTPEPGTALLWFTGVMGLAAFWGFRKHLLQNADQGEIRG
jgi:hypothetical protein